VVVLRSVDAAPIAQQWLEQQGWEIGKVLVDLKLVHVWLPRGQAGLAAVQAIRSQPWARYVTNQAIPHPSSGHGAASN
jgi:hypothetical protein